MKKLVVFGSAVVAGVLLAACGTPINQAPVEDRTVGGSARPGVVSTVDPKTLPGAENAGKPGYYTVNPGDTLVRIGLETGQSWKDLARWNNLSNPDVIEVGQVIRVVPPVAGMAAAAAPAGAGVVAKPVTSTTLTPGAVPNATTAAAPAASAAPSAAKAETTAPAGTDQPSFAWPAAGSVLAGFDEPRNKGLDIAGKAGDAVLAAADGKVAYVGAVRGYGNLVIVQHNSVYLTAYAHNQRIVVKEDQTVRRGQKIAEMGNTDADRVKLHFEIRRQGKPVDPARLLPAR